MSTAPESGSSGDIATCVPFDQAVRVWARIGVESFGGPAGQIAVMHRILVEERKWIGEARFLHALNFCMLLPGPEAQQTATYVGWLLHGVRGGLVAGTLFVLPGFLSILALSLLYVVWHDVGFVAGALGGARSAVLVIVLAALWRVANKSLRGGAAWALALGAFAALYLFHVPFPIVVLGAALLGALGLEAGVPGTVQTAVAQVSWGRATRVLALGLLLWFTPVALCAWGLGTDHVLVEEGLFFSKVAVVTFGGAYAVLTYVAQAAVETHGWLSPVEMLDGLSMAETTPGPLIQVVQFVGFLGAWRDPGPLSALGAALAASLLVTWVTYVPCFLWIFLFAPFVEALRGIARLRRALAAITAAVVGVIANLSVWFGIHVMFTRVQEIRGVTVPVWSSVDPRSAAIAVAAAVAIFRFKVGMLPVLAVAAALGMFLGA